MRYLTIRIGNFSLPLRVDDGRVYARCVDGGENFARYSPSGIRSLIRDARAGLLVLAAATPDDHDTAESAFEVSR